MRPVAESTAREEPGASGGGVRALGGRFREGDGSWKVTLLRDALMVHLALLNLALLLFDFTYLSFRPFYLRHAPAVVRLYDPVKGIEPHPLTTRYLETVDRLEESRSSEARAAILEELREMGRRAADHEPFARVGQEREIRLFDTRLRNFVASRDGVGEAALSTPEALDRLWRPDDAGELSATLEFFDEELRPLLAVNYFRAFDRDGDFVDHGWLVDLPFLLIFSLEFYGRWILAVRRRTYAQWWAFPLLHWYDLLGIVPLPQFRFFRLFRVVPLYLRLSRSDRSAIGEDAVSRTVGQVAALVADEVTDRVTVRILTSSQQALAGGIQGRITRAVLEPKRDVLRRELAVAIERAVADPEIRATARHFLDLSLAEATVSAEGLRHLPLPRAVVEPLVQVIGRAIFDSVTRTLEVTLRSEAGRGALEDLLGEAVDATIREFSEGTAERLLRESLVETLEEVKLAVALRTWAERRPDDAPTTARAPLLDDDEPAARISGDP